MPGLLNVNPLSDGTGVFFPSFEYFVSLTIDSLQRLSPFFVAN